MYNCTAYTIKCLDTILRHISKINNYLYAVSFHHFTVLFLNDDDDDDEDGDEDGDDDVDDSAQP